MSQQEIDPLDLDAQEAADAVQADATRLQRQLEVDDLKWLMSSKQGRRVMWRLLGMAGVFRSSFVAPDAMQVAFLEGHRNIGLTWLNEVHEHVPERYHAMVKEQQQWQTKLAQATTAR